MASSNSKLSEDALKSSPEVTSNNHVPSTDSVKPLPELKKHDGLSHEKANGLNNKVDEAINFLASIFEGGQSSQENQDALDEFVLIDWLKLNVGDHEECEQVLNGVKARVFKANALINELRAMGHYLISQRAVVCNTQPGVLPTSLPTSRDQVNPVAARRKRQTPLNDNSNGINLLPDNNVPKITNVATSSSGRVSLTAPKATNVARRPSPCVPKKTQNSLNLIVLRMNVVCNTPTGVVGNHSLAIGGDQITPVATTWKRQTAMNDSSRVTPRQTKKVATTPSFISLMQTPTSGNSIVDLHTPMVGRATQCSKKASTTCVTTTIPGIQTRNSTYEVGESSRRPKRSKKPPLQFGMLVRFNLDEADGNVRKVYDKHVGISEEYYDHGDPTFECKECHALVWEAEAKKGNPNPKNKGYSICYGKGKVFIKQAPAAPKLNSSSSSALSKSKHPVDRDIIKVVKNVLDTLSTDGRTYNLPTANEVVGLIVGDFDSCAKQRDIVIEKHREGLERINIFYPLYLPLQYPLLMSCGQDGYHLEIPHRKRSGQCVMGKKDKMVSMREWFACQIQDRPNQENLYVRGGRLFQQFLVDGYTMVETERLYFHRAKQSKLRCDTYSNISKSVAEGNTDPMLIGKPVVLSSSFTGGPRYMKQNYMDVMALCRWYGCPNLFITITCNLNWPKMARYMKAHNLSATDRPDVMSRVFKMKVDQLMKDPKDLRLFEFALQKRVTSTRAYQFVLCIRIPSPSVDQIDKYISAEIPDKNEDPDLYKLVSDFMMHGPCGEDDPTQPEIPYPDSRYITEFGNRLIYDETDFNPVELQTEYERLYASLTTEQKGVYDTIMNYVETVTGGVYFVYGYGGTGKTFLWKTLAAGIRRRGDILLNVASRGIASLLMSGGRTAHSRFHIPINVDETSTCSISAQSDLEALLKKCKLIIWDEAWYAV
ncbi:exostosin family protein [Tanacetum coccineum]